MFVLRPPSSNTCLSFLVQQPSSEKKTALPSAFLNNGTADQIKPVQDVFPEVEREMQNFSAQEKKKVAQKKQELRTEISTEMKNFSQNLKLPSSSQPQDPTTSPAPTQTQAATPPAQLPQSTSSSSVKSGVEASPSPPVAAQPEAKRTHSPFPLHHSVLTCTLCEFSQAQSQSQPI